MNIILYRYSPWVSKINTLRKHNCILFVPIEQKEKYEKYLSEIENSPEIIYFENYSLKYFVLEIEKLKQKVDCINTITTQCEEDIIIAGLLHDFYCEKQSESMINMCFRDKYIMRSFISSTVSQPDFELINNKSDIEKFMLNREIAVIKNRYGFGTNAVYVIRDLNDLKNISIYEKELFSGNYIIESYIDSKYMITNDGYFIDNSLCRFFVHEYGEPVLESVNNKEGIMLTRTSKLYNDSPALIDKSKLELEKVFNMFSLKGISPFHAEWFIDENGDLVLCEVARRFGGASIPSLINEAFNIDILTEYWTYIQNNDYLITNDSLVSSPVPNKIAASFQPIAKEGMLKSIVDNSEVEWLTFFWSYYNPDEEITYSNDKPKPILFISEFSSINEKEFNVNINKLNKIVASYKYY